ncbi:ABC transporter substrate-binding protein [Parachlamydia acanthamoebae]|uniref:ABC transporter substrate-binding protein n=1 Tax=Parachlamydia acanthamoebae TaxID=83552 RepID=UPI00075106E6|nr:ABC transporter substrate-binding protein [Parachlamydia acanthamoebae]
MNGSPSMAFNWQHLCPYLFGGIWIALWWTIAFHESSSPVSIPVIISEKLHPIDDAFSRPYLQKALQGDIAQMEFLLIQWHQAAESLKQKGISPIWQLETSEFLQALLLIQNLRNQPEQGSLNFLPQTYPSACFLLALLPTQCITALPDGFQIQTQLFHPTQLKQIPINRSLCSLEYLWKANPAVAFISSYSNPAFVSALHRLQIPCISLPNIHRIHQIESVIQTLGTYTDTSEKAQLLSLFIKAALNAIDNKISEAFAHTKKRLQTFKPLFLFHYQQFSVPLPYTLTSELITRLHFQSFNNPQLQITPEMLKNFDPDLLIIASQNVETLKSELSQLSFFPTLKAAKLNHIFWVDSQVQHSPSQFFVLAYYDLAQPILSYLKEDL